MNWTKEKIDEVYEAVLRAAVTDEEFRAELLADPKKTIGNLTGGVLPDNFKLKIVEEEPAREDPDYDMTFYLPPLLDDELSEKDMDQVAGGGIGDFCRKVRNHIADMGEDK